MKALKRLGIIANQIDLEQLSELIEPVLEDLIPCINKIAWNQPLTGMHPTAIFIASALYDWLFVEYSHIDAFEPTVDEARIVVLRAWRFSCTWAEI